jgi:hypothetical protein
MEKIKKNGDRVSPRLFLGNCASHNYRKPLVYRVLVYGWPIMYPLALKKRPTPAG